MSADEGATANSKSLLGGMASTKASMMCLCKTPKMTLTSEVWVCGHEHWVGPCCVKLDKPTRCKFHRVRVVKATNIWRQLAADRGAWECPMKHGVFGQTYEEHVMVCALAREIRDNMSDRTTALVQAAGHDEVSFDCVNLGVKLKIAFKDGNAVLARVDHFCPPSKGNVLVELIVSDVNVATKHKLVLEGFGPTPLVPLPIFDAALYCTQREVAVSWKRVFYAPSTERPSSSLLRPAVPHATQPAGSGSAEAEKPLSASPTEQSTGAATDVNIKS